MLKNIRDSLVTFLIITLFYTVIPYSYAGIGKFIKCAKVQGGKSVALGKAGTYVWAEYKSYIDDYISSARQGTNNEESYISLDDLYRLKNKISYKLSSYRIVKKADKYKSYVEKYATLYNISPQLVLAIIHTESLFNPRAKSSQGAYGLMQIIPRFAGKETYKYIYKRDIKVTADYLYKPEKNIEIGVGYLYLLKNSYFKSYDKRDKDYNIKIMYLMIASYNWGPGSVKNKLLKYIDLDEVSHEELYSLIRLVSPPETSDYLKKVTERMSLYEYPL